MESNEDVPTENELPPEQPPLAETTNEIEENEPSCSKTPRKRKRSVDDPDEGRLCPVCFDHWTSSGQHRLVSLKCGHLFGLSCVQRWLRSAKTCPTCNGKAKKNDIRELYAAKLVVVDTTELEDSRKQIKNLKQDIEKLKVENNDLKMSMSYIKQNLTNNTVTPKLCVRAKLVESIRLDEGTFRVLAYCATRDLVCVSQENKSALWPGYGVRIFPSGSSQLNGLIPLHKKEIRDMEFHPTNQDLLLCVSLDCYVKVFNFVDHQDFFQWKAEEAIWSACWGFETSSIYVYIGTARGRIFRINCADSNDVTEITTETQQVPVSWRVPVCSLRPSTKLNCILCCRLMTVHAYVLISDGEYSSQELTADKYSAMVFSDKDCEPTMVLCCRPDEGNQKERFIVYRLSTEYREEKTAVTCTQLHVIYGGAQTSLMTRPTLFSSPAGLLFVAFREASVSSVSVWRVSTEKMEQVASIKCRNFVRDILATGNFTLYLVGPHVIEWYKLTFS